MRIRKYCMSEKNYYQEWKDLCIRILEVKGVHYALGLLIGILARNTAAHWDIRRDLHDLQDRYPKTIDKKSK